MSLRLDIVLSATLRYALHAQTTPDDTTRAASEAAFRAYLNTIDAVDNPADHVGYRQRAEEFYRLVLDEPPVVDLRVRRRRCPWLPNTARWIPTRPVTAALVAVPA